MKYLRGKNDYSQKRVADAVGISNVQLSRYESGDRKTEPETIVLLADFFEVTTDYLLGRVDHPLHYAQTKDAQKAVREKGIDVSGLTDDDIEWLDNFIQEYKKIKNK